MKLQSVKEPAEARPMLRKSTSVFLCLSILLFVCFILWFPNLYTEAYTLQAARHSSASQVHRARGQGKPGNS